MGAYGRILLTAVAMGLLCRATSSPIDEAALQDLLYNLQSRETGGNSELRIRELQELANLYEEAKRRGAEYPDDPENPLQARLMDILQQHDLQAEKRASCDAKGNCGVGSNEYTNRKEIRSPDGGHMTLCHFKICNMGRKRAHALSNMPRL